MRPMTVKTPPLKVFQYKKANYDQRELTDKHIPYISNDLWKQKKEAVDGQDSKVWTQVSEETVCKVETFRQMQSPTGYLYTEAQDQR